MDSLLKEHKKILTDPNFEHLSKMHSDLTTSLTQSLASPVLMMNLEEDHSHKKTHRLGDAEKDDLLNLALKAKKSKKEQKKLKFLII